MKLILEDDNKIIVFLNYKCIQEIDFSCKDSLEEYFQNLFLLLKRDYDLKLDGYYNIDVLMDSFYGVILIIEKEELEYFDYYDHQVDMCISVQKDCCFLYEIEDLLDLDSSLFSKMQFYVYKKKVYGRIVKKMTDIEMAKLLEYSEIIYGNMSSLILRFGQILTIKDFSLFSL